MTGYPLPARDLLAILNSYISDVPRADECICHRRWSSSFSRRHLIIPPGLHRVHGLVAVVPGVQLLVSRMVVDAAVAGVALWEEYHRALITAEKKQMCHWDICGFVSSFKVTFRCERDNTFA